MTTVLIVGAVVWLLVVLFVWALVRIGDDD
jgi:hypothetical protein